MNSSDQHSGKQTVLGRGDVEDSYPLSPLQHGMLFHNLMEQAPGVDVEQIVVTLHEDTVFDLFIRAWQRVVDRHAILRTAFEWKGRSEPRQSVYGYVDLPVAKYDWCDLTPVEQKRKLDDYLRKDWSKGIDLTSALLFRIAKERFGDGTERDRSVK